MTVSSAAFFLSVLSFGSLAGVLSFGSLCCVGRLAGTRRSVAALCFAASAFSAGGS